MTTRSELFVDEDVRDCIQDELDKLGCDYHIEVPTDWQGINNDNEFPSSGTARVYDNDEKTLGYIDFEVKFGIEFDVEGRYITAEPFNVRFRRAGMREMVITFDDEEIDELMALEGIKGFELPWVKDIYVK